MTSNMDRHDLRDHLTYKQKGVTHLFLLLLFFFEKWEGDKRVRTVFFFFKFTPSSCS